MLYQGITNMAIFHSYVLFSAVDMKIELGTKHIGSNEPSVAPTLLRKASSISASPSSVSKGSPKKLFLETCHLNFCSSSKGFFPKKVKTLPKAMNYSKLLPVIF